MLIMKKALVLSAILAFTSCGLEPPLAVAQPMPAVNTALGCTVGQLAGNVSGSLGCINPARIVLTAKTLAINSTGDKATLAVPAGITKYAVQQINVFNCTGIPILAQLAIWTGAAGTGTNVAAAATITGATSATAIVNPAIAIPTTTLTSASLFVNVAVANLAAATCDVSVVLTNLS